MPLPTLGPWIPFPVNKPNPYWDRVKGERLGRDPCPEAQGLHSVNAWVNTTIAYERDPSQWRSPRDALAQGKGDCKDIAVLKRAILLAKGYDESGLYIVTGKDIELGEEHAVLWTSAGVMDNLSDPFDPGRLYDADSFAKLIQPDFAYSGTQTVVYGRQG